ncbi:MAG: hypothetical protein UHS47_11215 [Oscillospiraceae bacterium]|nr:hypothetical protein [Oscillospiraceae bacterium]
MYCHEKLKNEWKELLLREKICTVLLCIFGILAFTCLILDILHLLNILTLNMVAFPVMKIGYLLLACMYICRSVVTWRKSKGIAIVGIVASVILLATAAISIYLNAIAG